MRDSSDAAIEISDAPMSTKADLADVNGESDHPHVYTNGGEVTNSIDTEDDTVCGMCKGGESSDVNPIVFCDGPCNMAYHQDCIGIDYVPEGDWFCTPICERDKGKYNEGTTSMYGVHVESFIKLKLAEYNERKANSHTGSSTQGELEAAELIDSLFNSVDSHFNRFDLSESLHVLDSFETWDHLMMIPLLRNGDDTGPEEKMQESNVIVEESDGLEQNQLIAHKRRERVRSMLSYEDRQKSRALRKFANTTSTVNGKLSPQHECVRVKFYAWLSTKCDNSSVPPGNSDSNLLQIIPIVEGTSLLEDFENESEIVPTLSALSSTDSLENLEQIENSLYLHRASKSPCSNLSVTATPIATTPIGKGPGRAQFHNASNDNNLNLTNFREGEKEIVQLKDAIQPPPALFFNLRAYDYQTLRNLGYRIPLQQISHDSQLSVADQQYFNSGQYMLPLVYEPLEQEFERDQAGSKNENCSGELEFMSSSITYSPLEIVESGLDVIPSDQSNSVAAIADSGAHKRASRRASNRPQLESSTLAAPPEYDQIMLAKTPHSNIILSEPLLSNQSESIQSLYEMNVSILPQELNDEICCELWLLQQHFITQFQHNINIKRKLKLAILSSEPLAFSQPDHHVREVHQQRQIMDVYAEHFLRGKSARRYWLCRDDSTILQRRYVPSNAEVDGENDDEHIRSRKFDSHQHYSERIIHRCMHDLVSKVDRNERNRKSSDRESEKREKSMHRALVRQAKRENQIRARCKSALDWIIGKLERVELLGKRGVVDFSGAIETAAVQVLKSERSHRLKTERKRKQLERKRRAQTKRREERTMRHKARQKVKEKFRESKQHENRQKKMEANRKKMDEIYSLPAHRSRPRNFYTFESSDEDESDDIMSPISTSSSSDFDSLIENSDDSISSANSDDELFCLCATPYRSDQFYIACDHCEDWYHGDCVSITQSGSEKIDRYICPLCESRTSEKTSYLSPKDIIANEEKNEDQDEENQDKEIVTNSINSIVLYRNGPNQFLVKQNPLGEATYQSRFRLCRFSSMRVNLRKKSLAGGKSEYSFVRVYSVSLICPLRQKQAAHFFLAHFRFNNSDKTSFEIDEVAAACAPNLASSNLRDDFSQFLKSVRTQIVIEPAFKTDEVIIGKNRTSNRKRSDKESIEESSITRAPQVETPSHNSSRRFTRSYTSNSAASTPQSPSTMVSLRSYPESSSLRSNPQSSSRNTFQVDAEVINHGFSDLPIHARTHHKRSRSETTVVGSDNSRKKLRSYTQQ